MSKVPDFTESELEAIVQILGMHREKAIETRFAASFVARDTSKSEPVVVATINPVIMSLHRPTNAART